MSSNNEMPSNNETPEILYNIPEKSLKPDSVFWAENPNILFHKDMIFELFPIDSMGLNQQLNAISRVIILLTIITFLFTRSIRILIIGAITLGSIYLLYFYKKSENKKNEAKIPENKIEAFENPALAVINSYQKDPYTFDSPTETNPFSNVLVPDYEFNPQKKPAPPAFNENTNQSILENAKKLVQQANPGQPNIADKLFKDLGEQFIFEQSLQPFYSNPGTTIPNDQAGFADFCYGSMVSCKEGNLFACARNLDRHTN